jgi:translation initiation factor IF-3
MEKKNDFRGGGKFDRKKEKDGLRVNREIRAPQVRVIDEAGQMLGVMTVPEAVRLAEDRGLDLLEIAPTATPPTCKIMDYGKWKYENKKKATAARKKQVIVQVKEIQLRPRTDQHDFETKMKHARRFLLEGDKVKINMRFLGRELAHQELGVSLMNKAIDFVKEVSLVESQPKLEGKQMFLILAPDPLKVKDYLKLNPLKKVQEEKLPEMKDNDPEEGDE